MTPAPGELAAVASAVRPGAGGEPRLFGDPRRFRRPGEELAELLENDLYRWLYTRAPYPWYPRRDELGERELLHRLAPAAPGGVCWQPGWSTVAGDAPAADVAADAAAARIAVERGGLVLWAAPEEVRREGGGRCRLRVARELRGLAPGFYTRLGAADPPAAGFDLRLYWHLASPEAAVALIAAVAPALDGAGVPWRAKVLSNPRAYRRADAGVLYLERSAFANGAVEAIAGVHAGLGDRLRPAVPLLTKRLAPGLGLAEDPGGGRSFGQHRCQLLAGALERAHREGLRSEGERLAAVVAAFEEAGLDPRRPYLGPGSTDGYPVLAGEPVARMPVARVPVARMPVARMLPETATRRPRPAPPLAGRLRAAARALGDRLCRRAFRLDGRCNWVGRVAVDLGDGRRSPAVAALGPDLYGGVAGVSLFLARLHAVTSDERHRRAAVEAIRGAFRGPVERPHALYDGGLGVVLAARRVGELLDHREAVDLAEERLGTVLDAALGEAPRLDLISGAAGSILALLALRDTGTGVDDRCLAVAVRWGEELLAAAERDGEVWSWAPSRTAGGELAGRPLTGLSHGTAGVAVALLELAAAERDAAVAASFRDAARGAFAYEDRLYDPERRNWPDLRRGADPPRFAVAWCHGAPGIALARLRAMELDPAHAGGHRRVAEAALATTVEELRRRSGAPDFDASPCHGLLGLAAVAVDAATLLGEERHRRAAVAAAVRLLDHSGRPGRWPSGVAGGGWNPSLMLGDAGVGWVLLRLAESTDRSSVDQPELSPGVALSTRKVTSSARGRSPRQRRSSPKR